MQNQIPNNWQQSTLGGTATLNYGKSLPETIRNEGGVPVYGSSGITGYHNGALIKEEGFIIGRKGTVGAIYYSPDPFYPIDTVYYSTKSDIKCNFEFFYYLLKTLKLDKLNSDSAVPGLNRDIAYAQVVLLPTIHEQQKIASILSAFDKKIGENSKIVKTLEEMGQAIFKEWFIKFRIPGYGKVEFADSELGKITKRWKISKFEQYARLEYGKALQEDRRISGEVLVYGSSGQVGTHTERLLSGPGIVVGRKRNVGSVYWVDEDFYPIDTTFYVDTKNSLYYIFFILKNMQFYSGDSAVPGLNRESVHSQRIIIPDKFIVDRFDSLIKPIFEKINSLQKENQKLTDMRDLLLPKLMKGEIRV